MKYIFSLLTLAVLSVPAAGQLVDTAQSPLKEITLEPGTVWRDTDGEAINAHGGGLLHHEGTYYWYGEIKKGPTRMVPDLGWEAYRVEAQGVSCYSSRDLTNWKNEETVLPAEAEDLNHDLHTSKVIERPKVIYNASTKQFVMWMHLDNQTYSYARAGVAVSASPTGPFTYRGSVRPNGNESRDMTVFQDDDGQAYLIYTTDNNQAVRACALSEDYLSPTANDERILNQSREAPAVFKYQQRYYLITSGVSGWNPNEAAWAVADSILGTWQVGGNPCVGPGADRTFGAQNTFVMPLPDQPDTFLFMADRWEKTDLVDSRYLWLPLKMVNAQPRIAWTRRTKENNKQKDDTY